MLHNLVTHCMITSNYSLLFAMNSTLLFGDLCQGMCCVVVLLCPDLILLSEFYFLITEYTINVSSSGCNQNLQDTVSSTAALNNLQGTILYSSPTSDGIRLEYPLVLLISYVPSHAFIVLFHYLVLP